MNRKLAFGTVYIFLQCLGLGAWAQRYDLLIRNGRVVDGSGNPWYRAEVGIKDGKIVAIAPTLAAGEAAAVLDAQGMVVAPGFIDVHTHVEGSLEDTPTADNFLHDGVTTIVTGNCGSSNLNLAAYFARLQELTISPNFATLVGHNAVRRAVMRLSRRDPTPEELAKMEAVMDKAMREGAVGLSTGLIYIPGTYANTSEVVTLAKVAAKYRGVYASHIRNEADSVLPAIREAIDVGRRAGLPVEISHLKASGRNNWGQSAQMLAAIEAARAEGIDVNVDQYPYTASSTNLGVLLPSWALADGDSALAARLADPATKQKIVREIRENTLRRSGSKRLDYAFVARHRADSTRNGLNIQQIAARRLGKKPSLADEIETVLQMMLAGGAQMIYHTMGEDDIKRILQYPNTMIASDAGVAKFGRDVPHPRAYGTNARVLGHYVRELKALRLEDAIRRMTSLPAQRFGFADRGLLKPGLAADLVIFDPAQVTDRATFDQPHAYTTGIAHVLVNGVTVILEGKHTGARPGHILKGNGSL
jgi:N-acyl-D-amino-acid deacylase